MRKSKKRSIIIKNVTASEITLTHKAERPSNYFFRLFTHYQAEQIKGSGRVVQWCWVNFQCRRVLLIWIIVGHGPIVLVVGAGGGCLDIFLSSIISHLYLRLSGKRSNIDCNTVSKCR